MCSTDFSVHGLSECHLLSVPLCDAAAFLPALASTQRVLAVHQSSYKFLLVAVKATKRWIPPKTGFCLYFSFCCFGRYWVSLCSGNFINHRWQFKSLGTCLGKGREWHFSETPPTLFSAWLDKKDARPCVPSSVYRSSPGYSLNVKMLLFLASFPGNKFHQISPLEAGICKEACTGG